MKRESVRVLEECIELQKRKSKDYQNPNSNIVQSMHYRRGVSTIHDMIHQKLLRAQSLLETQENNSKYEPNYESLEDSYKDLINYASFAVSYLRGGMEGQDHNRDYLNRKIDLVTLEVEPLDPELKQAFLAEEGGLEWQPKDLVKGTDEYDDMLHQVKVSMHTFRSNLNKVKDIGDRMDDDMDDLRQNINNEIAHEKANRKRS